MSRLALGAVFAGGFAWAAARLAVTRFADEEVDCHGWTSAAGDLAWSRQRSMQPASPLVLELPEPAPAQVYTAA